MLHGRGSHVLSHCRCSHPSHSFRRDPRDVYAGGLPGSFCRHHGAAGPGSPAFRRVKSDAGQAQAQQKPARVTTTVIVHGEVKDDYLPETVTVGTLDGATLQQAPLSATVVTRDLLNDQVSRLLSDVVKNDASIGEDYAPVGYYGDFEIRGFPIDLATGLEINGMTIAGEQDVPLENKQSVEFLKGIAGVESGVASAGGLIDYVTKRPAAIEAVDLGTDHRGTAYGAVDLGHLFGSRKQVGARVNLAGERIQSYVNGADGWRAMGAGAADWKLSPKAILNGNFEYQHKVERSVCGYQLLGGDDASRSQPHLPLDHARRAVVGEAEHLRHLQHRRAARLRSAPRLASLCRRQLQPLAHRRQRGLCLRVRL